MCLSGVRAIRDLVVVSGVDGQLHGLMLATFRARRVQGDLATLLIKWGLEGKCSEHVAVVLNMIVLGRPLDGSEETSDLKIVVGQRESCLSSLLVETGKDGLEYTTSGLGNMNRFCGAAAIVIWPISIMTEGMDVRT